MAAKSTSIQRIIEIVLRVVDETKGVLSKVSKGFTSVETQTKKVGKTSAESTGSVTKLGNALKSAGEYAQRSIPGFEKSAKAAKKLETTKVPKAMFEVKRSIAGVVTKLRSYVTSTGKAIVKNKVFSASIKKVKSSTGGLKASLQSVVGAITGVVGALSAIIFPVTKAAKFQRAMAEVKAISGATDEEIARLTERASELGRTTEYTGIQAARGMKMLAMAGLGVSEVYAAIGHMLEVAHAGTLDLGEAADIVTNIMTGFRLEISDLGRVGDVLVQTFTNTNSTLQELGHAMAYVAPVAAGLGADFEDLTATVGLLHNAGLKGTMAGTALRGMLFRLFNPTKEEADLMETLNERIGGMGLQLRDTTGKFVGFVEIVKQLEGANLDAAEAMALFGQRAGPGMAALLGMGSAALAKYVELNKKAEGRAAAISRIMGRNVVGAFREMNSIIGATVNLIGKQLLPTVEELIRRVTRSITAAIDWAKEHKKVVNIFVKVAAGIGLFIAFLGIAKVAMFAIVPMFTAIAKVATGFIAVLKWGGLAITSFYIAIAVLVAFILGLTFSKTFREWVGDLKFFGVAVKDWGKLVLAEFGRFWAEMIFGFKTMWLDLKEAVGLDVSKERAELEASLIRELQTHDKVIDSLKREANLSEAQAALQDKITAKIKAQEKATADVAKEYEDRIKKVRNAWTDAGAQITTIRKEIENLIARSTEQLDALGSSIGIAIAEGFESADTSELVRGLQGNLLEIERAYEESDDRRKYRTRLIENEIAQARIGAVERTIRDGLAAWTIYGAKQKAMLDTALTAQLITQREYATQVRDLEHKVLEAKRTAYKKASEILQGELDKSLAAESDYADKIKDIKQDINDFHKSSQEKVRAIWRKGLTEEKAYYDKVKELQEKLAEAKALGPEQYEEAKKLFKEVQSAAGGLVGEIKEGDKVVVSKQKTIATSINLLKEAYYSLQESGKLVQTETKDRLIEQQGVTQSILGSLDTVTVKFNQLTDKLSKVIQVRIEVDTTAIDKALAKLEGIEGKPGLITHYAKQKEELDALAEKLGELELALLEAKEAAVLEVNTQFDPEIEELKADIIGLGGEVPSSKVEVDTEEVAEATEMIEGMKESLKEPVTLEVDTSQLGEAVGAVDHVREEAAPPIPIVLEDNVIDIEANIKEALARVREAGASITVDLSTTRSIEELERLAQEVYEVQEETGKPLDFVGISTTDLDAAIHNIGLFKEVLAEVSRDPHKVEIDTTGEEQVEELAEKILEIEGCDVEVVSAVVGIPAVEALVDTIAELKDKTVTIVAKYVQEGALATAHEGGLITAGGPTNTLVGEYVLCREAVAKAGLGTVHRWNRGIVDAGKIAGDITGPGMFISKAHTLISGDSSNVVNKKDVNVNINMSGRAARGLTGRARRLLDQLADEMDLLTTRGASFG